MKQRLAWMTALTFAAASIAAQAAGGLTVRFTSPLWNGNAIPAGQQCARLGGSGATPGLNVFDVPTNAGALLIEYSERSGALDGGKMGRFVYTMAKGAGSAQIAGIAAGGPLPAGVKSLGAEGGAIYLPPCTAGGRYLVNVKALPGTDPTAAPIAEGRLDMGKLP